MIPFVDQEANGTLNEHGDTRPMKTRSKRMIGLILLVIACLWLGLAQGIIWTAPVAAASEAPDRHLATKESIIKRESYDFALPSRVTSPTAVRTS